MVWYGMVLYQLYQFTSLTYLNTPPRQVADSSFTGFLHTELGCTVYVVVQFYPWFNFYFLLFYIYIKRTNEK